MSLPLFVAGCGSDDAGKDKDDAADNETGDEGEASEGDEGFSGGSSTSGEGSEGTSSASDASTTASTSDGSTTASTSDGSTTASTSDGSSSSDSTSTSGTDSGSESDSSSSSTTGEEGEGCDGATLLKNPSDTSLPGQWPVGARTVQVDDFTVEVLYPAQVGSEQGKDHVVYDIRTILPGTEGDKIPDDQNPWQDCNCYADLPIDTEHGPYPVVVFVHGTAGWRTQSLKIQEHWASRGFIVIAADHPGLYMAHLLGSFCGMPGGTQDLGGDIAAMLAALETDTFSFLEGKADLTRVGMSGHSAGGGAISSQGAEAQVLIPLASGGVTAGAMLQSTLVMGAMADTVANYSGQVNGYNSSPAPKRLVGIENGGHLTFSDICGLVNSAGDNMLEVAEANGVCGTVFAGFLFDCQDSYLPPADGWEIVQYATSAVLEEVLHCSPDAAANFATISTKYPAVTEYQEEL